MADQLKDIYNKDFFDQFTTKVKKDYPPFNPEKFLAIIFDEEWDRLELKQRISKISQAIHQTFPAQFEEAIQILMEIVPGYKGFNYLFFPDFVEKYGLEDWDHSIKALEIFTQYSSAEFAVRAFIRKNPSKMMKQMQAWSTHENEHVRRLASEGCRPRLPWAAPLRDFQHDPSPILPILEQLKQDPSKYVQKSVANNLNDISKDHPKIVKHLVHQWKDQHSITDWILRHGCRTLLKKADKEILQSFGYPPAKEVQIENLSLSKETIELGETLTFCFQVNNNAEQTHQLRIEYAIDFMKANGKTNRKIFQLSSKSYPSGIASMERKQKFVNLTTRKHYSGKHVLTILINGEEKASVDFELIC